MAMPTADAILPREVGSSSRPPRGWRRVLGALLVVTLGGACASVDAGPDFDATSRLVEERTGGLDSWNPEVSEADIDAAVEALLADGLTVAEAVRVALLCNPSLRASYEEVGIGKAELVAAGLPANPAFLVSTRVPDGNGPANVTVSLSQGLLDLFLIPARRRAGEARLSMARWAVVRDAVQLCGRVQVQAFDLLALDRGRALTAAGVALAERSEEIARRRQQAGLADAVDVSLAHGAVLEARRELLGLKRDVALGRAALQELLGLAPEAGDWELVDELPAPRSARTAESLVETALARRLDVEVARLGVEVARGDLGVERRREMPDLALGAERETEGSASLTGPVLEGALPLWSRNEPATSRAEFALQHAVHELGRTRNEAARQVREAAARVDAARGLAALFEDEILPQAHESLSTAQRAWQAGERDVLVLLEAQRALLDQQRRYVEVLRDGARAGAELDVALGGLGQGAAAPADAATREAGG